MNLKNSLVSNSLMIARYLADKNKKTGIYLPVFCLRLYHSNHMILYYRFAFYHFTQKCFLTFPLLGFPTVSAREATHSSCESAHLGKFLLSAFPFWD